MLFIRNEETQLVSSLANILGNKPNLTVIIESIKAMSDDKSQVLFFVQEKGANGEFPADFKIKYVFEIKIII